jgi:type IV fimbrial biogenesis protein FimT
MSAPVRTPHGDAGYTLIEVMVTIALLSAIMLIAISGWSSYAKASAQDGAAQEVQSVLRQAQQRAVTEGSSMCVLFDTANSSFKLYRRACDDSTKIALEGPWKVDDHGVRLESAAFTSPSGPDQLGVTFTPRGTAWPGQVKIKRADSGKVRTVDVEGLTGRVSSS